MAKATEEPGASGIQVIARAADILRVLGSAPDGLTQSDLADLVGLARSTIHRLLRALEEEGLVETAEPRGRHRLGPEIARLAESARRGMLASIHPLLEELSQGVDETVDLSVLERGGATFVDQVVAPHRLRAVSAVGESFPLHCTANGKAFLVGMSPEELSRFLSVPLVRLTPRTITDPAELQRELRQVHAEGIAFDREEHTEGICAVGARLRGLMGVPVAVSIPMPAQRFYGREDFLRDSLLAWTEGIEREFGGAGDDAAGPARARLPAGRRKVL